MYNDRAKLDVDNFVNIYQSFHETFYTDKKLQVIITIQIYFAIQTQPIYCEVCGKHSILVYVVWCMVTVGMGTRDRKRGFRFVWV